MFLIQKKNLKLYLPRNEQLLKSKQTVMKRLHTALVVSLEKKQTLQQVFICKLQQAIFQAASLYFARLQHKIKLWSALRLEQNKKTSINLSVRERSSIERTFSSARISPFRLAAHTTPIAQSVLAARFWMENFKADFQRLSFVHCRVLIQLFRSFKVVLKVSFGLWTFF